ncbi:hypothetical protein ACFSCW_12505 [Sphingomonas tabacisoli]|uniref:Pectate lyase superfamily protein domain-containing protein n=1 Tax=Sphingomonas tabacisoli TaxID=2249466 RepID=A0ABW4I3U9_9SPHN
MAGGATAALASQTSQAPAVKGQLDGATGVSLNRYGFRGDGRTDDTRAWRDAIEEAAARNIQYIFVPPGETGVSTVSEPIVRGKLPAGLSFIGEGSRNGTAIHVGVRLRYTGAETCWFINFPDFSPVEVGQWSWRGLAFEAIDPRATMFDFNDAANHAPVDGGGHSYLVHARFEGCFLKGGQGGARQTGDGIRAAKLFDLFIDKNCSIRDWRRGVWLRGCDDCTIEARMDLNTRNIHHENSGTFGSNLQIRSNFLGRCPPQNAEPAYIVFDSGSGTLCMGTFFEGMGAERALLYLNGYGTTLVGNRFAGAPFFEMGPQARELTLITPACPVEQKAWRPIIHPPESWDFGYQQQDYRALVLGGTKNFRKTAGAHPRLLIGDAFPQYSDSGIPLAPPHDADFLADARGCRPRKRLLTALNNWGKVEGTPAQSGSTAIQHDQGSCGWLLRLDPGQEHPGIAAEFIMGVDIQPGDTLRIRLRYATTEASAWTLLAQRNFGSDHSLIQALPESDFGLAEARIETRGWKAGDTLGILVLKRPSARATCLLDFVEFLIDDGHDAAIDALTKQVQALSARLADAERRLGAPGVPPR